MKEDIIQSQIRLIAFKATKVTFNTRKHSEAWIPKFELNLSDVLVEDKPNIFAKVFSVNVEILLDQEILVVEVEFHTIFECSNKIDGEFLKSDFAKISAPAIGFPFVRSFISTITLQGGFPPIILPSINFIQFAKEGK